MDPSQLLKVSTELPEVTSDQPAVASPEYTHPKCTHLPIVHTSPVIPLSHFFFGKRIYWSLTGCNFLNVGDILMLQNRKQALDEYILILLLVAAHMHGSLVASGSTDGFSQLTAHFSLTCCYLFDVGGILTLIFLLLYITHLTASQCSQLHARVKHLIQQSQCAINHKNWCYINVILVLNTVPF